MIKKILKKKHKGSGFGDVLATCICLVLIMTVIMAGTYFFKLMEIKKNINAEVRAGMLILEQNGELTDENINGIKASLVDMGFNVNNINISFNEGNNKAAYGEEVQITVEATATYKELGISRMSGLLKSEYKYKTTLHSISKAEE